MTSVSGFEAEMKDQFYSVAECLFKEEKRAEAVPLYRYVIERETDHNDQTFLLCHFRLFQCLVGISSDGNKEALGRFEPLYSLLPEDIRLDALLLMANVYYTLGNWIKVDRYGDELHALAQDVYNKLNNEKNVKKLQTERRLVVYYGQGLLLKGIALTMQGRHEEAKEYVAKYSDLTWFQPLDEIGRREVEKFRLWGKGNMMTLELRTGNPNVLPEFSKYLEENPGSFCRVCWLQLKRPTSFIFLLTNFWRNSARSFRL
ncbi:DNA-binding protein [Paenibacillus elgii]|uniref:DNA-binding protein n=1 Tax=Paenibacillus elgii TaxID=189691 RepID=UPI00203F30C6|nr:DNA-binding protein [Paenibacillus elgii]MCM3270411.1 DNA-binding protein [Paenibacillus elgii]